MKKMVIITKNEKETRQAGELLAKELSGNEIIGLEGDLGSGKTTFVQGLAKGLGIRQWPTSPSFILMREYSVISRRLKNFKLYHIDCYRLKDSKELLALGFKDLLESDNIIVIEWSDKIRNILPKKSLWIKFEFINETTRKITFN